MIKVNEPDRDMLAVLPEWHAVFAIQPCSELFVGPNQSFSLDREENCPEFVDDFIRSPGVFCNLRVDLFKGFNEMRFNENICLVSWKIFSRDVGPAGFSEIIPGAVTDSVGFVKGHEDHSVNVNNSAIV